MIAVRKSYGDQLPLWVLIGALLGAFIGIFLGDQAVVLKPIGTIYVMLMQIVVFPYIICSLLHGLGQLAPDTALRLLRSSWAVYLVVWLVTFGTIFLLSLAIPAPPPPSFIDQTQANETPQLLALLIPANPFAALVQNAVPAIVIFSIVFGVAIQKAQNKAGFLEILEVIRRASVTIWHWVVLLAPFGVAALFADTVGTVRLEAAADLSLYLILFIGGSLTIALWLLPSLISAVCPVTPREVLRDLRDGLTISVVTTLSVAALPYVQQAAEKFTAHLGIEDETRCDIIRTSLAVAYPLAQLGNFFIWLFILFGAFYFRIPIDWSDTVMLPFLSLLAGIGSPSSSIDAVNFLSEWLAFPDGSTGLFVAMMTLTRYGQVVASVMGFTFITFLVTLNYYGKLKLNIGRLATSLGVAAVLLAVTAFSGFMVQKQLIRPRTSTYLDFALASDVTAGVKATIETRTPVEPKTSDTEEASDPAPAGGTPLVDLARIQRNGELRVGINPFVIPFSYHNKNGDLVGYDIAYLYQLARDLNVDLKLVPFDWYGLVDDLKNGRFDLAASGIYVTDERLQELQVSAPYFQSPIALIVRSENAHEFLDRAAIAAREDLVVGVLKDPILTPMVKVLFPKAQIEILDNYALLPQRPDIDTVLWSLEQAKAFAEPRPEYTAILPKNLGGKFLFAYLMPSGSTSLRTMVDYWIRLQQANGFHARMVDRWIEGNPIEKPSPRWSILRNVLGWGGEAEAETH